MVALYKKIDRCRVCGSDNLRPILDLGEQALTGVFPKAGETVPRGPIELVQCAGECGLVQLRHSYDGARLYGDNYGYRSGLNASMVKHLNALVAEVQTVRPLRAGDLIMDIGANDSTLLQAYPRGDYSLVGVDPSGAKFQRFYPPHVRLLPEYFSAASVRRLGPVAIMTSIAMFYDLADPLAFMRDVHETLADDGIWVLEQSYLPMMLANTSYDTVCSEHATYYGLRQIKWLADRAGFDIVGVSLNNANGGSFRVTTMKRNDQRVVDRTVAYLIEMESTLLNSEALAAFKQRVFGRRDQLVSFVRDACKRGQTVAGLGASTKGNVILQFCGFTANDIEYIGDVNEDKFGCRTPGSNIPIVSDVEVRGRKPDYMVVLPWHFRDGIIEREREYMNAGGKLVFPLPTLDVVG